MNFPVPRSSWRLGSGFVRQLGIGTRSWGWGFHSSLPTSRGLLSRLCCGVCHRSLEKRAFSENLRFSSVRCRASLSCGFCVTKSNPCGNFVRVWAGWLRLHPATGARNEDPPIPKVIQAVLDKLAGSQGKVTGVKPPEQPTLTPAGSATTDPAGNPITNPAGKTGLQVPPGKLDYKSRRISWMMCSLACWWLLSWGAKRLAGLMCRARDSL